MKEFTGKLKKIKPNILIKKEENNRVDNLFLVLGLIYNDLKGLILWNRLLYENYRNPTSGEISCHSGEFSGMQSQIYRLLISLIGEFLISLQKHKDTINSIEFRLIEKDLPKNLQDRWKKICAIAFGANNKHTPDFLSRIAEIRNNVTFHYDHSGKVMRKSFIKKFYETPKGSSNNFAFYSLGPKMESTRFYYCDGAIVEYINEHLIKQDENYFENAIKLVGKMNQVIVALSTVHIDKKVIQNESQNSSLQ